MCPRVTMGKVYKDNGNDLIRDSKACEMTSKCYCINKRRQRMDSEIQCPTTLNCRAQWLSGRVFDSRPKGRGLAPHRRHCVVVLEQEAFILA